MITFTFTIINSIVILLLVLKPNLQRFNITIQRAYNKAETPYGLMLWKYRYKYGKVPNEGKVYFHLIGEILINLKTNEIL